jgi:hypothetical protein
LKVAPRRKSTSMEFARGIERFHLPSATGSGASLCRRLRASSRRCHRPIGQSQPPGRTQDWIKLGGKVRIYSRKRQQWYGCRSASLRTSDGKPGVGFGSTSRSFGQLQGRAPARMIPESFLPRFRSSIRTIPIIILRRQGRRASCGSSATSRLCPSLGSPIYKVARFSLTEAGQWLSPPTYLR